MERNPISRAHVRQRYPEGRLRTLAAQSRRGTWQCAHERARGRRVALARARCVGAGARAHRLGARASQNWLIRAAELTFAIIVRIVIHLVRRFTTTELSFFGPGPRAEGEYPFA